MVTAALNLGFQSATELIISYTVADFNSNKLGFSLTNCVFYM